MNEVFQGLACKCSGQLGLSIREGMVGCRADGPQHTVLFYWEALEGATCGDALGPWHSRSDLGLGGGQLSTTLFQLLCLPCHLHLLVLPDSRGCDPNPILQVAEMIKVVIARLSQGPRSTVALTKGGCQGMLWGKNQGLGPCPRLLTGSLTHPLRAAEWTTWGLHFLPIPFLGSTSISGQRHCLTWRKASVTEKPFRFLSLKK